MVPLYLKTFKNPNDSLTGRTKIMFWVRYVIIAINERLRVATVTHSISFETVACIFERNPKLILVSTLKLNGLLANAQMTFWIPIQLKVSLKMLQHPTNLEERIFCSIIIGICAWIINIEETFELTPSAPTAWKELTDIIVNINGAVMSLKEP